MVSKCHNSRCAAEFRYFGDGKLFEFTADTFHESSQLYWLCNICSQTYSLERGEDGEVRLIVKPAEQPSERLIQAGGSKEPASRPHAILTVPATHLLSLRFSPRLRWFFPFRNPADGFWKTPTQPPGAAWATLLAGWIRDGVAFWEAFNRKIESSWCSNGTRAQLVRPAKDPFHATY